MNSRGLYLLGFAVILLGFAVVVVGALGSGGSGPGSTGGFVLIGPIPIVFGTGVKSGLLGAVAVGITVAMVALYLATYLLWRAERRRHEVGRPSE